MHISFPKTPIIIPKPVSKSADGSDSAIAKNAEKKVLIIYFSADCEGDLEQDDELKKVRSVVEDPTNKNSELVRLVTNQDPDYRGSNYVKEGQGSYEQLKKMIFDLRLKEKKRGGSRWLLHLSCRGGQEVIQFGNKDKKEEISYDTLSADLRILFEMDRTKRRLPCIFLSICSSYWGANRLAQTAVADFVVGTPEKIGVSFSNNITSQFYDSVMSGENFDRAVSSLNETILTDITKNDDVLTDDSKSLPLVCVRAINLSASFYSLNDIKGMEMSRLFEGLEYEDSERELIGYVKAKYTEENRITNEFCIALPLEESYTQLAIVTESEQLKNEKDALEKQAKDKADKMLSHDKLLTSFEQIYGAKNPIEIGNIFKEDKVKRVLISGRAGVGKSTLCHHLAYQWANPRVNLWADKFELVVWVPLRKILKYSPAEYTVAHVVYKECVPTVSDSGKKVCTVDFVEKKLSILSHKTLWILDGFDEIAGALKVPRDEEPTPQQKLIFQLLNEPNVIITSRPYAIDAYLGSAHSKPIDLKLENIGFPHKSIELFIRKFFEAKHQSSPSLSFSLAEFLKANPSIYGIAHIPINLLLICHSWADPRTRSTRQDGSSNTLTMTGLYSDLVRDRCVQYLEKFYGRQVDSSWFANVSKDPLCQGLLGSLRQLAFEQMQKPDLTIAAERIQNLIDNSFGTATVSFKEILQFGLLKSTGRETEPKDDRKDYYFVHLTFQEFFAAWQIAEKLKTKDKDIIVFIQHRKYDAKYEIVWWFVAGLLSMNVHDALVLQCFFDVLFEKPRTEMGYQELVLLGRCLDEAKLPEITQKDFILAEYARWIEQYLSKAYILYSTPVVRLLNLLALSPRLASAAGIQKVLLESLKVQHVTVFSINAIAQLGPNAARGYQEEILELLNEENLQTLGYRKKDIVSAVIRTIGDLGPAASDALKLKLLDFMSDKEFRGEAIKAIGRLGSSATPNLKEALLKLVQDDHQDDALDIDAIASSVSALESYLSEKERWRIFSGLRTAADEKKINKSLLAVMTELVKTDSLYKKEFIEGLSKYLDTLIDKIESDGQSESYLNRYLIDAIVALRSEATQKQQGWVVSLVGKDPASRDAIKLLAPYLTEQSKTKLSSMLVPKSGEKLDGLILQTIACLGGDAAEFYKRYLIEMIDKILNHEITDYGFIENIIDAVGHMWFYLPEDKGCRKFEFLHMMVLESQSWQLRSTAAAIAKLASEAKSYLEKLISRLDAHQREDGDDGYPVEAVLDALEKLAAHLKPEHHRLIVEKIEQGGIKCERAVNLVGRMGVFSTLEQREKLFEIVKEKHVFDTSVQGEAKSAISKLGPYLDDPQVEYLAECLKDKYFEQYGQDVNTWARNALLNALFKNAEGLRLVLVDFWGEDKVRCKQLEQGPPILSNNAANSAVTAKTTSTTTWQLDQSKAREFYSKAKVAFFAKRGEESIQFFQLAKDKYKDVLSDSNVDSRAVSEAHKRLAKIKEPNGKYASSKLLIKK